MTYSFHKKFFSVISFLLMVSQGFSAGIRGQITNASGEPVPFATVYVSELHHGTTANEEGKYRLSLEKGTYEVRFQYLGYKTIVKTVDITPGVYVDFDVVLQVQQYSLPEVIVTASGEDPAYYIMRRAIGLSQYYLNQVSEYSCQVYLKGTGVLTSIPALMRRQLEREGVEKDQYFVTETISKVNFRMPDQLQTHVISTRSSGSDNQTSPMAFVTMSLYQDINGIISPLSRSAFRVYRFKLEGTFMENGHQVNKIRVIPRRSGPDLYRGHIFIKDGTWNLHSVDLMVEQSLFTIQLRQVYNPVGEGVWMPVSHDFDIQVAAMGFELNYKYLATVSEYDITLNPDLDHSFYIERMTDSHGLLSLEARGVQTPQEPGHRPEITPRGASQPQTRRQQRIDELMARQDLTNREMRRLNRLIKRETRDAQGKRPLELRNFTMEVDDSARVRTVEYWNRHRPVPLTPEELASFGESDTPKEDTLDRETSERSAIRKLVTGSSYVLGEGWRLSHNGLVSLSGIDYNTVNGLNYSQRLTLTHRADHGRRFSLGNTSSWAFARERFQTHLNASWFYHPFKRATLSVHGGRVTQDFHHFDGLNPFINATATLFLKQNQLKLYERDFARVVHRFDVVNGLVLTTSAEFNHRRPLENHSDFYIANLFGDDFTENIPPVQNWEDKVMPEHKAFVVDARLSYTHRHFYYRRGNVKQMAYSRYPTVSLYYKEAIPNIWNSDVEFRQLEASINQRFDVRLVGQFAYRFSAGRFFDQKEMAVPDFKHFQTHPFWVMSDNQFDQFRTLPLYGYSTNDEYFTAHGQYEHSRILFKRLPVLSKTLIREKVGFSMLSVPGQKPWFEASYGMNQVFLLFNAEVVTGFSGGTHQYTGFRIGIPLGGATIRM